MISRSEYGGFGYGAYFRYKQTETCSLHIQDAVHSVPSYVFPSIKWCCSDPVTYCHLLSCYHFWVLFLPPWLFSRPPGRSFVSSPTPRKSDQRGFPEIGPALFFRPVQRSDPATENLLFLLGRLIVASHLPRCDLLEYILIVRWTLSTQCSS